MAVRNAAAGNVIFLWWLSKKRLEKPTVASSATTLLAKKVAPPQLILKLLFTAFRTRTGMAPRRSSCLTTHSVLHAVNFAQLASYAQETVMWVTPNKVQSRSTDSRNSLWEFSKKWVSSKLETHRSRISQLLTTLKLLLLELAQLPWVAPLSLAEWDIRMCISSKRILEEVVSHRMKFLRTEHPLKKLYGKLKWSNNSELRSTTTRLLEQIFRFKILSHKASKLFS